MIQHSFQLDSETQPQKSFLTQHPKTPPPCQPTGVERNGSFTLRGLDDPQSSFSFLSPDFLPHPFALSTKGCLTLENPALPVPLNLERMCYHHSVEGTSQSTSEIGNAVLSSYATKLVVICYSSPRSGGFRPGFYNTIIKHKLGVLKNHLFSSWFLAKVSK